MKKSKRPRNFREFSRMGSDALWVMLIKDINQVFVKAWPVIILVFFNDAGVGRKMMQLLLLGLSLLVLGALFSVIRYFTSYFKIENQCVVFKRASWVKSVKTIPLEHIHTIRTTSGFFYRLVDMVAVCFDCVVQKEAEVELLLSKTDLELLLKTINEEGGFTIPVSSNFRSKDAGSAEELHVHANVRSYSFGLRELIQGAVTQNPLKGLGVIFAVLVYVFNESTDLIMRYQDVIVDNVSNWYGHSTWSMLFFVFVVSYLITLLIWIAVVVIRKYGLSVSLTSDKIHYQAGMFTRRSAFVSKDKIVGLTFKQNILERITGVETVSIEQSDSVEGEKGKERIIIYGWKDRIALQNEWFGAEGVTRAGKSVSGQGLFWYHLLVRIFILIIPSATLVFFVYPLLLWGVLPFVAGVSVLGAYLRFKRSAIAVDPAHVLIYHGQYSRKQTFLPIRKIESVLLCRTFMQKRSGRVRLSLNTMGGLFTVRSLPLDEARAIRDYILYKMEMLSDENPAQIKSTTEEPGM